MVKKSKSNKSSGATQGYSQLDDEESLADWGFSDNYCHHCGKKNSEISGLLMQCGRCKQAYYCSNQCFKDGYPQHSLYCGTGKELGRTPEASSYVDRPFFDKFGEKPQLVGATNNENQQKIQTTKVENIEDGKYEKGHEREVSKDEDKERSKKKTAGEKKKKDAKKSRKAKESKNHDDVKNIENTQQKKKKSKKSLEEKRHQQERSSVSITECDLSAMDQIKQIMNDSAHKDVNLPNELPTIKIFDDNDYSNRITTTTKIDDDDGENVERKGIANEHNETDMPQMAVLDSDSASNDGEDAVDSRYCEVFGETSNANSKLWACESNSQLNNIENQSSFLVRNRNYIEKEESIEKESVALRHVETSTSENVRHKPEWGQRSLRSMNRSNSSSSLLMDELFLQSLDDDDQISTANELSCELSCEMSCELSFHSCLTSLGPDSKHNASSTKALRKSNSYKFLQKEEKMGREVVSLRTAPALNKSDHVRSEPEWASKRKLLRRAVSVRGNELIRSGHRQNEGSFNVDGSFNNIKLRSVDLLSQSDHIYRSTERRCENREEPEWASKRLSLRRSSGHNRKGMSLDSSHGRSLRKVVEKDVEKSNNDDSSSCPSSSDVEFYDSDSDFYNDESNEDEASVSAGHVVKATQLKPNRRSIHAIETSRSAPVLATLLEKQSFEPNNGPTSNAIWDTQKLTQMRGNGTTTNAIWNTQKFTQMKGVVQEMDSEIASQLGSRKGQNAFIGIRKNDLLSKSDHIRIKPGWSQQLHSNRDNEILSDNQGKMLLRMTPTDSSLMINVCSSSDIPVNENSKISRSSKRNSVNFKPRNFTAPRRRSSSGSGCLALKRSTTSAPILNTLQKFNDEPDMASRGNVVWEKSNSLRNTQMGDMLKTKGDIAMNRPDLLLGSGKVQWEKPDWTSKKPTLKRVQSSLAL